MIETCYILKVFPLYTEQLGLIMIIDMNYTEIDTDFNQLKFVQNGADDLNKAYIVYRDIKDAQF